MSMTFTDKAKQKYEKACEKNNEGQDEFYYCSTSDGITQRSLDLNSKTVFCKTKSAKSNNTEDDSEFNHNKKEYKLEAFIIKTALKDLNHMLPIKDKKWLLLDAERNFAQEDLSKCGKGRKFDILAYEIETRSYIVLELKIKRNLTGTGKRRGAHDELLCYTDTMKNNIKEANNFYSVNAKNVRGYIVWPSTKKPQKYDKPWGLIEYDEEKLDNIEKLKFAIIREHI